MKEKKKEKKEEKRKVHDSFVFNFILQIQGDQSQSGKNTKLTFLYSSRLFK